MTFTAEFDSGRMLPIALCLVGTGVRLPTRLSLQQMGEYEENRPAAEQPLREGYLSVAEIQ